MANAAYCVEAPYKVLIAIDPEFMRLPAETNARAATLALLKMAIYEEDGSFLAEV